jgi:HD superfamily phosphohydrolase
MKINQKDIDFYTSQLYKLFKDISEPGGGWAFRYWHGLRVMSYINNFLKKYPIYFAKFNIDSEIAIIAGLFHDIGKIKAVDASKIINYSSKGNSDHQRIGGDIIKNILKNRLGQEKIEKISNIIKEHSRPSRANVECLLVSDCDILDNCGLLKLWRTITYAHYQKKNINRIWEYWEQEGCKKIKDDIGKIHFPPIKKTALRRFKKLDSVIKEIKREAQADDF